MDSRLYYAVFRHAIASATWLKHGTNEYIVVGDGETFDVACISALVDRTFSDPVVCFPKGRNETLEIPKSEVASFIVNRIQPRGEVTVSDPSASKFLQVLAMGVARVGQAQANTSFKVTPASGAPQLDR